jgi:hypothetical protein
MGNNSQKRSVANAKRLESQYGKINLAVTGLYVLVRILWGWDSFGFFSLCLFALFSGVNYGCSKVIFVCAGENSPYSAYQDVLWINWFVEVTSLLSSWFLVVYLTIPAYVLFHYGGMIKNVLCPDQSTKDLLAGQAAGGGKQKKQKYKTTRR